MKIVVTGSNGLLGKNTVRRLNSEGHRVFGVSRKASKTTTHIADLRNTLGVLESIVPDCVIHCAALTAVDYCELNRDAATKTNVEATRNISKWAKKRKVKLIYISTDYVYPGKSNEYNEDSEVNPINFYGRTKLQGEELVSKVDNHLILRPTVIFGIDEGLNFLMQILRSTGSRNIPKDQVSNPTSVEVICDYLDLSIKKDLQGTYVSTGPEKISRLDFGLLISDVFGLDPSRLVGVSTSDLNQAAKRPLRNGTDSRKLWSHLSYTPKSLRESLERMKKQY